MNWLRLVCTLIALLSASPLAAGAQVDMAQAVAEAAEWSISGAMACGDAAGNAAPAEHCSIGCVLSLFGLAGSQSSLPGPASGAFCAPPCDVPAGDSAAPDPHPPRSAA